MSAWSSAGPLVGVVLGVGVSFCTPWLNDRRAETRALRDRKLARSERVENQEIETYREAIRALDVRARSCTLVFAELIERAFLAANETEPGAPKPIEAFYGGRRSPNDLSESDRLAALDLGNAAMLILDDDLRAQVEAAASAMTEVCTFTGKQMIAISMYEAATDKGVVARDLLAAAHRDAWKALQR